MALQINSKLNTTNNNPLQIDVPPTITNGQPSLVGTAHQQSNESVDLDNLFAFLSEVTPNQNLSNNTSSTNTVIDDISEKMDTLVQDLDIELEHVIQQEIEGLALEKPKVLNATATKMGIPSLPEPTMPPPPPPIVNGHNSMNQQQQLVQALPPPPPPTLMATPTVTSTSSVPTAKNKKDEPIYEAVIPRTDEFPPLPEIPEINSNAINTMQQHHHINVHHLENGPKLMYLLDLNYLN